MLVCLALAPLSVLLITVQAGQITPVSSVAKTNEPWQLVWADEFDHEGLPDATRWTYDVGSNGWGNRELQFYTSRRLENARVENGHLIIEARREKWQGRDYTSARLVTRGKVDWLYGRFEIRAKLPSGRGTWPAIWMLPAGRTYGSGGWPDTGEIDIMEHVGHDPDVVHGSTHTRTYHHSIGAQKTATIRVNGARTDFNVYSLEWSPEEIKMFANNRQYFFFKNERLTNPKADYRVWPFDRPFYLILNLAVGGFWGGEKGVDPAIWPQRMEVDYVRVYKKK
jgi:beta-glucanase (GH16 family)